MPAQETPVPSRASGLSDAEAKRTHKLPRAASASPTPSRRISPWLSAKAVLLVPLRPPHRPGQTASSASGCLHPQMQSVCAALRLLKKMGTLFMLHGSIAQHLQKVYKIFRYFLSIPSKAHLGAERAGAQRLRIFSTRNLQSRLVKTKKICYNEEDYSKRLNQRRRAPV